MSVYEPICFLLSLSCRPFSSDRDRLDDFGLSCGISTSDPNKEDIRDRFRDGELDGEKLFWRHFEVFGLAPLDFSSLSSKDTSLSLDGVNSADIILVAGGSSSTFFALLFKLVVDFSSLEDP